MTSCFADTYYFLALMNENDEGHELVLSLNQQMSMPMVTTAWILTEVADAMSDPPNRPIFLELLDALEDDGDVLIVPPDHDLFQRGVELFGRRLDKGWSLADCISVLVMEDHRIDQALTADHHFEQAGFRLLMK